METQRSIINESKKSLSITSPQEVIHAKVLLRAEEIFGSREKAQLWLSEPNGSLGGISPMSLLDTEIGASQVFASLGRIEHGVFV